MPFSEESLWRLAVKGGQIFGNAGANDTMAGRCPYEEIAQYGNVMLRAVKGTGAMWVAVPRAMKVELAGGATELRLGDGLVGQADGKGAAERGRAAAARGLERCVYEQYVWTFAPRRTRGAGNGGGARVRLTGR